MTEEEIKAAINKLLAEKAGGDQAKLSEKLFKVLLKARDKISELEDENEELRESSIGDGFVAISKADADLLDEYRALGKPADLKAATEKVTQLQDDIARRDRDANRTEVARTAGYVPEVLRKAAADSVQFVPTKIKDEKSGKEFDSFNVVDTGPDGKPRTRTLDQWEEDPDVKPLLPALKASRDSQTPSGRPQSPSGGYQGNPRQRQQPAREEQPQHQYAGPVYTNAAASL
jgi:hypothetical protein